MSINWGILPFWLVFRYRHNSAALNCSHSLTRSSRLRSFAILPFCWIPLRRAGSISLKFVESPLFLNFKWQRIAKGILQNPCTSWQEQRPATCTVMIFQDPVQQGYYWAVRLQPLHELNLGFVLSKPRQDLCIFLTSIHWFVVHFITSFLA